MKVAPFAVACVVIFRGFAVIPKNGTDPYVEYDIDEMNEFWDSTDEHSYSTRTSSSQQSVDIMNRIISHDEIYLLRYWD